jgi:hypothetical protein
MIGDVLTFLGAMAGSLLPHRLWDRLPAGFPLQSASFASGLATFFLGAAIGIPGFLEHMAATVSLANETTLKYDFFNRGLSSGFAGLSIFTFLLLTPKGWLTMYLMGTGGVRMAAAWFGDPVGDPVLTGLDVVLWRRRARRRALQEARTREDLEGPETPDRVVSPAQAGIPGCELVIVASRAKPGWSRGVVVYTADTCYRIGDPVERTIAGNLRTLYPLTEHTDLEAVRRSVHYDLPTPGISG